MNKPPFTEGQTLFVAVDPSGCICSYELYSSAEDAVSVYTDITGGDPGYVLELQVTKVGVPLHKIDWDLS